MPNVKRKKAGPGSILTLLFIAMMIVVAMLDLNAIVKLAIVIALMLLYVVIRLGYVYFFLAVQAINKKNPEKAWPYMEKAIRFGIDAERKVMVGSAYIQYGDAKRGIEILEGLKSNKDKAVRNSAVITSSMGYWRIGELDKAISVLQELRASGYSDSNLLVNLETYLLLKGDIQTAKEVIEQSRSGETSEGNGLLDNRGWYCIQAGEWETAAAIYEELLNERNAKFPEAYLHGAQASIHMGDFGGACERLSTAMEKNFTATCMLSKDYLQKLIWGLSNPDTSEAFALAMDEYAIRVSCGLEFPGFETAVKTDAVIPASRKASSKEPEDLDERDLDTSVDDDDREPNTDLDEDDETLAAVYDSADDEDEIVMNTDVDDDDREPNTDLDENE